MVRVDASLKGRGETMAAQPTPSITVEEYLAGERTSEIKHEYYRGAVFAQAGGSSRHNLATVNVAGSLHGQLRKRECRVYSSDMRIKITQTGLYTYPDVTVVCGKAQFEDEHEDTLLNPTVIVEVLSPSTESYDRGKKFQHYRTLL
jgi:Uma2 family endonuclease